MIQAVCTVRSRRLERASRHAMIGHSTVPEGPVKSTFESCGRRGARLASRAPRRPKRGSYFCADPKRRMPASRTLLRSYPLVVVGLALLGDSLALAAQGGQQPPGASPSAVQQRVERMSRRATDRLRALRTEADNLASRERTVLAEIRQFELDRQITAEELADIDLDLADTTGMLEETATRAAALEREVEALRPLVEARLVALYKMGAPLYTQLLLGANDLRAVGRIYRIIGSLARRDREQFEGYRQTLNDLHAARATIEARQGEVAALQVAARAGRLALDRAIASQTALVEDLDASRDLAAQLIGELEGAQQRLGAAVTESIPPVNWWHDFAPQGGRSTGRTLPEAYPPPPDCGCNPGLSSRPDRRCSRRTLSPRNDAPAPSGLTSFQSSSPRMHFCLSKGR